MTREDIIEAVTAKFNSYKFHLLHRNYLTFKIDYLTNEILDYKTSPIVIPSGSVVHDPHKFSDLEDEREILEAKRDKLDLEVKPIHDFLKTLDNDSEMMLRYKFFTNDTLTYEEIAERLPHSRTSIQRRVNELCLEFWAVAQAI